MKIWKSSKPHRGHGVPFLDCKMALVKNYEFTARARTPTLEKWFVISEECNFDTLRFYGECQRRNEPSTQL